ncbi:MAG: hypothetical protein LKK13_04345 [Bacilli bacterium]|jgi:hypothetical protein|nr:hypothetical protein [Bacilli bacterium]
MPNILTHYTFAKKNVLDPSPGHLDATFVGAQGPDPFFFYGVLPFRRRPHKKEVRSLGGLTQHEELTDNYWAMVEYARSSKDKDLLFAYIDGLFMHYAVDRACHPYIFFNTGFTDRPEDSEAVRRHYNFGHMWMENLLDFVVGHREGTFQRPDKTLLLIKKDALAISKMWDEVNASHQKVPNVAADSFFKSLLDYRSTMRLAWNPLHCKKGLFKLLAGPESLPYGLVYPKSLKGFETIDLLNERHSEWRMPAGEKRHESFYDLLGEAKGIYSALHACLRRSFGGADEKAAIFSIAGHINHEGIVPGSPKIYWRLIWPASFQKDVVDHPKE